MISGRKMNKRQRHISISEPAAEKRLTYKDRIKKYRMAAFYRIFLVVLVLAGLVGIVYMQYRNHIYTDYEYVAEKSFNQAQGTQSISLGDCILTYSSDGAHCTDMDGTEVWNQTFQMQKILLVTSEDVAAIGDYNGSEVYIMNTSGKVCQISTTLPIRSIAVSATGRSAVAVNDGDITWIFVYEADGKESYKIRTTMGQSGYPAAFAFSPNGELLAMSCIFIDAGTVTSKVAFYNLGPVGDNKTDNLVSAFNYSDVTIPYIKFLDGDSAVAVGDDRLLFYSGDQIPNFEAQYLFEDEILGVYQNGNYLGLLKHSDMQDMRNRLEIYRGDSAKVGTFYFNTAVQDIFFTENYFVVYGDSECMIKTYNNVEKYSGGFDRNIDLMMPVGKGNSYKFITVSDGTINTVQLK